MSAVAARGSMPSVAIARSYKSRAVDPSREVLSLVIFLCTSKESNLGAQRTKRSCRRLATVHRITPPHRNVPRFRARKSRRNATCVVAVSVPNAAAVPIPPAFAAHQAAHVYSIATDHGSTCPRTATHLAYIPPSCSASPRTGR